MVAAGWPAVAHVDNTVDVEVLIGCVLATTT
jgi:hypothetical protein